MPSPTNNTTVLLLSTSDLWSRSARSVLASLPEIELLDTVHGSLTAYQTVLEKNPHLLIIDDSLPMDEVRNLVTKIKALSFLTYCICIMTTARNKKTALTYSVDAVITRSDSSQALITAVLSARNYINFNHSTAKQREI